MSFANSLLCFVVGQHLFVHSSISHRSSSIEPIVVDTAGVFDLSQRPARASAGDFAASSFKA